MGPAQWTGRRQQQQRFRCMAGAVTATTTPCQSHRSCGSRRPLPTFYVNKLLKYFARGGEKVVQAESDYLSLGVYAVKGNDQSLRILVINKHPSAALNAPSRSLDSRRGEKAKVFATGSRRMKRHAPERARPMCSNPPDAAGLDADLLTGTLFRHVIQVSKRDKPDTWGIDEE